MNNMDVLKYLDCKIHSNIKQEDNEEAWRNARTSGIGGSDIGVICGVNKYGSIRTTYFKKTKQFQDGTEEFSEASKERMHFGHVLEPVVADEFAKRTGKKVVACPATLRHKKYDWCLANVDRFIVDDEGRPIGVLECKSASEHMAKDWEDGNITPSYYYQLTWYLFITGLQYGALACLVGGNKFYYYEVFRDDALIAEMFSKADMFFNHYVKNLIEPPLTGSEGDKEYINNANKEVKKKSEIVLEDTIDQLAESVVKAKAEIKELEKIVDECQNRIKDKMGEHEIGLCDNFVIKWSPRSQNRVDTAKLKAKYPKIYDECLKTTSFRVMSIKGSM
jgi:putative phage-type endonuclease